MGIVIYTDWLIPKRFHAFTLGVFILIRPQFANDAGLHAHERIHVKQFLRSFGTMGLWYRFSKRARYKYELEAFNRQMQVEGRAYAPVYAGYLANNYNLDVTPEQALIDLLN